MTKPTRAFSNKQEDRVAKAMNGRRQSNSGATPFAKGDVLTENWLLECKTKTKETKTVTIRKEDLDKNKREASLMRKAYNGLAFDFGDGVDYYIISEADMQRLVELDDK